MKLPRFFSVFLSNTITLTSKRLLRFPSVECFVKFYSHRILSLGLGNYLVLQRLLLLVFLFNNI